MKFTSKYSAYIILVICGLFMLISSSAYAQVRSELPQFNMAYNFYNSPYECNNAVGRIQQAVKAPYDPDTLTTYAIALAQRVSKEAEAAAEHCISSITPDSLSRIELIPMMKLFLLVGRDKEAGDMVQRLLNGQGRKNTVDTLSKFASDEKKLARQQADIHYVAAITYLNAVPARLSAALSHSDSVSQLLPDERLFLANHYYTAFRVARVVGDTQALQQIVQRITTIENRMQPQERWKMANSLYDVRQHVTSQDRYDSLRKSTAAYVALQVAQKSEYGQKELLLGTKMKPLQGEFRSPSSAVILPVPGKVNLVVVPRVPTLSTSVLEMLRRLKNKYSEIEVVYSEWTLGFFDKQLMSPEQEAKMRHKWVQDFKGLPFSMVVEKSESWRLPAPDRRLHYGPTPNIQKYGNRLWLVDREGKIVFYYSPITKEREAELDHLIEALLKQK